MDGKCLGKCFKNISMVNIILLYILSQFLSEIYKEDQKLITTNSDSGNKPIMII